MNFIQQFISHLRFQILNTDTLESNDILKQISAQNISSHLQYLFTIISAILICFGIQNSNDILILVALICNPIFIATILFSLGISTFDISLTQVGIKRIIIHSILMILVSILYFYFTPLYSSVNNISQYSQLNVSYFIPAFLIGFITIFVVKYHFNFILFGIFSASIQWIPSLSALGYSIVTSDITMIKKCTLNFILSLFFIFLGSFLSFKIFNVQKTERPTKTTHILLNIFLFIILSSGLYYGIKTTADSISTQNIDLYLKQGLGSKSFIINSYEKDATKNEVNVYYSGVKSPNTQDENLKKKYKVSKYSFNYQAI